MIYLSRHGLRLNKVIRGYRHDPDPPIHHSGIQPLITNSTRIPNLDYIFCSPFIRCVQTAHYLNQHDAPIYIESGMSETLKERWFEHCGYNPLTRVREPSSLKMDYYAVDDSYTSAVGQSFPESRRDSRRRNREFMDWLKQSDYWNHDILLVGHGFSIKDSLNNLGISPPYQGWERSFPRMGHLFSVDQADVTV